MSDLQQHLRSEFQDEDYRYAYAESFLNTRIATQIKTLREQRGKTQVEIAEAMGIKQPGYRRFEDVNHSVWKTDSLWSIARALGVRVSVSFETFGSLLEDKKRFTKESLRRPTFADDPVFGEPETQGTQDKTEETQKWAIPNALLWEDLIAVADRHFSNYLDSYTASWLELKQPSPSAPDNVIPIDVYRKGAKMETEGVASYGQRTEQEA